MKDVLTWGNKEDGPSFLPTRLSAWSAPVAWDTPQTWTLCYMNYFSVFLSQPWYNSLLIFIIWLVQEQNTCQLVLCLLWSFEASDRCPQSSDCSHCGGSNSVCPWGRQWNLWTVSPLHFFSPPPQLPPPPPLCLLSPLLLFSLEVFAHNPMLRRGRLLQGLPERMLKCFSPSCVVFLWGDRHL